MEEEIVSLKNVSFTYNTIFVLEDINFSLKPNDYLGIIGPNGGGKTTLLKIILGLLEPNKGEVKVFGKSPQEGRSFIGYVPQYVFFDPNFPISVLEVVLMGRLGKRGLLKRYSQEDKEGALEALKRVDLLDFKDRQIGKLSGGQRQRVFVARALVTEPKLLLLDEPMASIDPEMQKSFYELLAKLKEKMAIVLVTHDVGVISIYVDKIACLNQRLYYHGRVEEGIKMIEKTYGCPIELLTHGVSHQD